MTDLELKLITLAAKHFDKDASSLTPTDDFFEKLGIDSYQAMDMLTALEDELGVELPDYEVQGVTTFSGLAEVIGRRL
jgi:acyl carrier protein